MFATLFALAAMAPTGDKAPEEIPTPVIITPAPPPPSQPLEQEPASERKYLPLIVSKIFFPPKEKMTIAPDKRDDRSSCDASEGKALIDAFQNCWPIVQGVNAFGSIIEDMMTHFDAEGTRTEDSPELQTRIIAGADNVIALSSAREWPLQDVLLAMAHSMKREIYEEQGRYDDALRELDLADSIFQTTRMDKSEFDLTKGTAAARAILLSKKAAAEEKPTAD